VTASSVADWLKQSQDHLQDAELLARAWHWQNACLLGGHAVECALKGVLMHRLRVEAWPDRTARPEYYTHDLARLAVLAGVADLLLAEVQAATRIGVGWQIAKRYALSRRYPAGAEFPAQLGHDMVMAISGEDGLVRWLIRLTQ
jgi:HEPN domain-containing protein